ncbi:MAG: hypothetical protein J3Q66DRAFT_110379 [Benniella sp.]|nr:MAG: hypothetical protein J3Q66DRAFT_110379 [Benniella sp.]
MKFTSVILTLSAVVAMAQAAPILGNALDPVTGVVDRNFAGAKRQLEGITAPLGGVTGPLSVVFFLLASDSLAVSLSIQQALAPTSSILALLPPLSVVLLALSVWCYRPSQWCSSSWQARSSHPCLCQGNREHSHEYRWRVQEQPCERYRC